MRVLILNDDVTSEAVVAHALTVICGMPAEQAWTTTRHVHARGHAEVAAAPDRDAAEAVVLRFLRYGIRAVVA